MKLQEQSVIKQVSIVEEVIRRVGDNMVVIIGAGAITSSISHYVVISCSPKTFGYPPICCWCSP